MRPAPWIAALALIVVFGCKKNESIASEHQEAEHGHEEEGHGDIELSPEAIKTAGIVSAPVQKRLIRTENTVFGIVGTSPNGRALVTPPVAGRVLRLLANVGESVRAGQPIAVVESVDLAERASAVTEAERARLAAEADVAHAASEVGLAKGRLRTAENAAKRQGELARAGAFSQPSLQTAERELNEARSALEGAQKEATVHRAQLERSERLFAQELVSRVEVENARLDVEKDRIAQERAEREIGIASAAFKRETEIARRGLLNAREVQAAEAEVRAARLDVDRAGIALRSARDAVAGARRGVRDAQAAYGSLKGSGNAASGGTLTLVAPMDGRVAHREATVGQAVERTTELFEIDQLGSVIVTAQVPEGTATGLRIGDRVSVTTRAYPDRRFAGVVETIGGRLDPKTRALPVGCRVPNGDGALRPEMFAEVALGRGGTESVLAVPRAAVFNQDGKTLVYVEEAAGRYEPKEVTTGRAQGDWVAIPSGLEAGARVVTGGVFTLRSQAQKDELKGHED